MKQKMYVLIGFVLGMVLSVYLVGAQSNPATELTADYLMAHDSAGNNYQINFGVAAPVTPVPTSTGAPTQEITPLPTVTPGATSFPKPTETPIPGTVCQAKVIVSTIRVRTLPDTTSGQILGEVAFNQLIGATGKYLNNDGYNWFEFYWTPAVPSAWVAYQKGTEMYMSFDSNSPACQGLPEVNPFQ